MAATKIKFSPSVNIIRDTDYSFNYIPTPNTVQTFSTILNESLVGIKSHVLIGAYGSGKSSFLLALKQTLEKSFIHFKGYEKLLGSIPNYEFMPIVGEFASLESYFAKEFALGKSYTTSEIIKGLDKHYKLLKKKGKGLAILIDEFGKFLEYAAQNNPESELYFIQQLAEWVNDSNNDTLLITTLHQDFSAYSLKLDKLQRQEWDKVKGRLKEVPFNEPVEQLLFLASERINDKFPDKVFDKNFDKLFDCLKGAKVFPLKDYFEKSFAEKLYPFDILSAAILTLSLQKYGQNERSLFSFIESDDHLGINEFDKSKHPYFSLPQGYDYLMNSYYSFLTTKYNPHYAYWSSIRRALEKVDGIFKDTVPQEQAFALIKVVGLLNIFATGAAKLDRQFYYNYAKLALGIKNPEELFKKLEAFKIIRFVNHSVRYTIAEGTDLDIELAIDDAGRLVEKVTHVVNHLNQYFDFPFIAAKAAYYEKGTPRFFQFKLSEEPIKLVPDGEVDGFINLIFSEDNKAIKKTEECSSNCDEAILYGFYKNTNDIKNLLFEIQKIRKVKDANFNDKIALRELESIQEHYVKLLNHYVLDNLYVDNENITWFFKGNKLKIDSRQKFNKELSRICDEIYPNTPVYKNELINKTYISGQVAGARKKLLSKILNEIDSSNLGFTQNEFPPEKSIYLTLLRETGIHQIHDGLGILDKPSNNSFDELWEAGNNFLISSRNKERNLSEFINILSSKPYKLKKGFIDFWVPIFLITKSDEFALFEDNAFVPEINIDILELLNKKPAFFSVKAFNVAGVRLELFNRYRVFLNQAENYNPTNKQFIQTIKPFLVFYRDLPEYSKKTNRLDKRTLALRKVIATAKDPEKAFFEDFPTALGYSLQELQNDSVAAEKFVKDLQTSIKKLRTSYDGLLDRFENYFVNDLLLTDSSFPAYKGELKERFAGIKKHLLLQNQKSFYNRMQSELEDRKAWLGAIAQSCIQKPLSSITDDEEVLLFENLKELIYEMDNLCEISKEQINEETEEVLKLEITSFVQGLNKNLLRIPKGAHKEIDSQVIKIKANLGKDKKTNITVLAKLLQELLNNNNG